MMNATEAQDIRTEAANLPPMPVVIAGNMLYAQGWKPTADDMRAITARADFHGKYLTSREVAIKVRDFHGALIGYLMFNV